MNLSFKSIRRADPEKYAPAHFLPPPPSHSHASPRHLMYRVAGMAFNFSAIQVPVLSRVKPVLSRVNPVLSRVNPGPPRSSTASRAVAVARAKETKSDRDMCAILNIPGVLPGF
jgi:hypothetical protein